MRLERVAFMGIHDEAARLNPIFRAYSC